LLLQTIGAKLVAVLLSGAQGTLLLLYYCFTATLLLQTIGAKLAAVLLSGAQGGLSTCVSIRQHKA
jgi:hypothetical protein